MRDVHLRAIVVLVAAFVLVQSDPKPRAQSGAVTLERLLSAPFPTSLVAAPARGAVAWVFNDRGVRNVWVAEAPDYHGRELTNYTQDDGQDLGGLEWTPDGRAIVYVHGGPPNRQNEIPNPTSDPKGAEQTIWIVPLDGGAPRKLADGSSPRVSPRGDRVAYLVRGQVWSVGLAPEARPAQLIKARGTAGSLRWSPDGSRLAFASGRGDHAFVGVYEAASATLQFLDPSVDRDGEPAWSPDGTRVAFVRIPADRSFFSFGPRREAEPWSIRVADVATGAGRQVWRAEAGRGSVFQQVSAPGQILWADGDRLVFPWEREGWLQLYTVPVAGGRATLLTPGRFEVEHVTLTPDRTAVVYSSNQDDIDRRHIWRVPVAGARPAAVTNGTGIEWEPAVTTDGAVAFLRSDGRRPAHPAVIAGSGGAPRELAPGSMPGGFPLDALVEPEPVIFASADGLPIHAQLFLPRGLGSGVKRPAVVFFHGGSRRQMLLGWHYLGYYHYTYGLNQYLASRGYVVLSVNYRSGTGYGLEFREALNYGAHGASEFNDVLGSGLYLRGRADVDPDRIGLWGGSYGGYLTAMGLARASDLFAAGVDIHGVHDWNVVIRNFAPSYDPVKEAVLARRAFESSPMASIDTWRSPVLLIHGDDDRNVPFSESVDLAAALRARGVALEQLVFPDEVHSFLRHARWLEAFEASASFFDRHLKRTGTPTSSRP